MYGSTVRNWAGAVAATLPAVVQPDRQVEDATDEQRTTTWLRVWVPPAADVLATDRLTWRGRSLEVVRVELWQGIRGADHHVEVVAREVVWA